MASRSRLVALAIGLVLSSVLHSPAFAQSDPNDPIAPPTSGEPDNAYQEFDLAAMTLDSTSIPASYFLGFERYVSADEYDDNTVGGVDEEELLEAGFLGYYDSWYFNNNGDQIRTFVGSFDTVEGLKHAFVLFEDEEKLHPNSDLADGDPLEGVGELPAETTAGTLENGDGTTSEYYDISFRIDRLYVGVIMKTEGDVEIDTTFVDGLAEDLADRVEAVLNGDHVSGVVEGLHDLMVYPESEDGLFHDGYRSPDESFVLFSTAEFSENIVGTYETGTRLTVVVTTLYPFLTLSISEFEDVDQVDEAMADPQSLIFPYQDMEEFDALDVTGADQAAGFVFTSSGADEQDSIRIFAQVENYLIIVDLHGNDSLEESSSIVNEFANALVSCVSGRSCDAPRE